MHKCFLVYVSESLHKLNAEHEGGFECELPAAVIKQILKGRAQNINYHVIQITILAIIVHLWNAI